MDESECIDAFSNCDIDNNEFERKNIERGRSRLKSVDEYKDKLDKLRGDYDLNENNPRVQSQVSSQISKVKAELYKNYRIDY